MTILIAEDDALTRRGLVEVFAGEGWEPLPARDGEEALRLFHERRPDAVCLDIMMPRRSGYDVCRAIRQADPQVPLLFLSAKSEEVDTVLGLELGADDFIVKPFGVRALLARVRAITRRSAGRRAAAEGWEDFVMDDVCVRPAELRAVRDGQPPIDLSLRDVKILALLHKERGRAITRDRLFDECWGLDYYPGSRSLDQHISQLRKKIEHDPAAPRIIRTVHGVGYRFE